MKTLLIAILFSSQAWAGNLKPIFDNEVEAAVNRVYDKGRHESDSGGIHTIRIYEVTGDMNTFQMVKEAMRQDPISVGACWDFGEEAGNECVGLVLHRSEEVQANYQFNDILNWTDYLHEWDEDDKQWIQDLENIEISIQKYVGDGFKQFAYGYDGIADTWSNLLISKDKKTVMVISSDYGA